MHKNAIKRAGRVIFRKKSNYKKPETQPKPVMSNPYLTRTRRNISKPEPDPNPTFVNPTHHYKIPTRVGISRSIQTIHFTDTTLNAKGIP